MVPVEDLVTDKITKENYFTCDAAGSCTQRAYTVVDGCADGN